MEGERLPWAGKGERLVFGPFLQSYTFEPPWTFDPGEHESVK